MPHWLKSVRNWKITSYVVGGVSTAVSYATAYVRPRVSAISNSIIALAGMSISILKNQEGVDFIRKEAVKAQQELETLEREFPGFSEAQILALIKVDLTRFQRYSDQVQTWSYRNIFVQLITCLPAQAIYQAAADEDNPGAAIHKCNYSLVPALIFMQMLAHIACAHKINAPKREAQKLRELMEQYRFLYTDPSKRLPLLIKKQAEFQKEIEKVGAEIEQLGRSIAEKEARIKEIETELLRLIEPFQRDEYLIPGQDYFVIENWHNPHTDPVLQHKLSENNADAVAYIRVYDSFIVPLTGEIEQLNSEIKELNETKDIISTKSSKLQSSLAIIIEKIASDHRVLNAPLFDESIFAVPEEDLQGQAGRASAGLRGGLS